MDSDPAAPSAPTDSSDEQDPLRTVELADGRRLIVRRAGPDDLAAVKALYGRLSVDDLRLRFFVGHAPLDNTTARWLTVGRRGGVMLVAEVIENDGSRLVVAEAGCALLDDGDGELAITVDPRWRGWLGGWLLDILIHEAARKGIRNLQAEVMIRNRTMLALLRHRGHAMVSHPDWSSIRLVISTDGHTPGWPPDSERPRLLVTAPGGRWAGEGAATEAGFEVRTCPGPAGLERQCPLTAGQPCPLLDGTDALVFDLVPGAEGRDQLIESLADRDIPIVMTRAPIDDGSGGACLRTVHTIEQIVDQLAERTGDA